MQKPYSTAHLTAGCCAGYLVMGLVFSMIGVGLEAFASQLSSTATVVGSLFFLCSGGATFIMLFVVGPLIDRFGQRPVLIAGSLLCAGSMLALARAESLPAACAILFVIGAGGAGLNGGVNTLINHLFPQNPVRALNLSNIFFGLGAVSLPFAAGWLINSIGLKALLTISSVVCTFPAVLLAFGGFPAEVRVEMFRLRLAVRALGDPLVALFGAIVFLYVGLEASLGIWSRPAVIELWKVQTPLDQFILAGFWGALVVGRLLAGTLFRHIEGHRLVWQCSLGASLGLALFNLADSVYLAAFAIWFSGLCFAPIFPSTLGSVGQTFKNYTGTIFSLMIALGVLGGVTVSTLVGEIAGSAGLALGFHLILGVCLALSVLQTIVSRRVQQRLHAGQKNDTAAIEQEGTL